MGASLHVSGLEVYFGATEAARGVSLRVEEGEVLGQVVETGLCAQLLTQPQHPYTKSLRAALPTLRTDRYKPLAMVG
jgi:ABC-type dipeptide/oligopeptide/nickel transport system ATPase component